MTEPESLPVLDQRLQRSTTVISEGEYGTTEQIRVEGFFALSGHTVDTLSKVDRTNGDQDLHLRRGRQHHTSTRRLRPTAITVRSVIAFQMQPHTRYRTILIRDHTFPTRTDIRR